MALKQKQARYILGFIFLSILVIFLITVIFLNNRTTAYEIEFIDFGIETVVRQQLNKPFQPLTSDDVLIIEHFSAPASNVEVNSLEDVIYFKNLVTLAVPNSTITDESLKYITNLKNLNTLDLWKNKITDEGLSNIVKIVSLRLLSLGMNDISDKGLIHLRNLRNLYGLDLSETNVTDSGINNLKLYLPNTRISY